MTMQSESIEFLVSFGYPKAMDSIVKLIKSRTDVQVHKTHLDEAWGCGEFCLRGTWDAYKVFLDVSRKTEEPESWFSIEHFEDDIV